MDFIFASAIRGCSLLLLLISYDIACQWFINFFKRMKEWPEYLRVDPSVKTRAVIPKFHEPAHTAKDHAQYCLHWVSGGAQCDCEGPERIWSPHNALGNSTKTQGPGHRHDTLDCHFAFWNFLKYISMGMSYSTCSDLKAMANACFNSGRTLSKKYLRAVPERNRHIEAHRNFTSGLPPDSVVLWTAVVEAWEAERMDMIQEPSKRKTKKKMAVNPYEVAGTSMYVL